MTNVEIVEHEPVEWQSEEALENDPRMLAMQKLVQIYEMPLRAAVADEYASKIVKRGWLVCGPSSIVLANLIGEDTGLPLIPYSRYRSKECLGLDIYMHNESGKPGKGHRMDHTILHYDTGNGCIMTIDQAYKLLWGGAEKGPGVTVFERHYDYRVTDDMRAFFDLRAIHSLSEQYTTRLRGWPDLWGTESSERSRQDYYDMLHIMHSPQVFEDVVETPSGRVFEIGAFWGQRLVRVYDAVRREIPRGSLDVGLWKHSQESDVRLGSTALSGQMLY